MLQARFTPFLHLFPPSSFCLCSWSRHAWLAVACVFLLWRGGLPAASPPQGADALRTIVEDTTYTFSPDDFGFADPLDQTPHAFRSVRLTSLPLAGTLLMDGMPAGLGNHFPIHPAPGLVWQPRESDRKWTCIAASADGSVVAAGTENGMIHVSRDGGVTWTECNPAGQPRPWNGVCLSSNGMRIACTAFDDLVFVSEDAGITWSGRGPSNRWMDIACSADGLKLAATSQLGPIYLSADGGLTWRPEGSSLRWSRIAMSHDGSVILAGSADSLFLSTDAGVTWTWQDIPGSGISRWWDGAAVSADGTRLAAVSGGIWLSDDAGGSWRVHGFFHGVSDIAMSADGQWLACSGGRRIYTSFDGGTHWIERNPGNDLHSLAISADGRHLWGSQYDGTLHHSVPAASSLAFHPAPNASGSPYASFSFQVQDSGPENFNLDPSPNTFTFHVTPTDDPPEIGVPLSDHMAGAGQIFVYQFPADSFYDPDPDAILTYTASQADGSPLPPWLGFSHSSRTFSGTPAAAHAGSWEIRVTATDQAGLAVSNTFLLQVAGIPQATGGAVTIPEDTIYTFKPSDFGFADPFDVPPHEFTRIRLTTLPALGTSTLNGNPVAEGDFVPMVPVPGAKWDQRGGFSNGVIVSSADGGHLLTVRNESPAPPVSISIDGGESWRAVPFFADNSILPIQAAMSADGRRLVLAVPGDMLFISSDGGETWAPRESVRDWQAVASSADGSKVIAVAHHETGAAVYVSHDFGLTWTNPPMSPFTDYTRWDAVVSSADGARFVVASRRPFFWGSGAIRFSRDGGATWEAWTTADDLLSMALSGNGNTILIGRTGGVMISDDFGLSLRWTLHAPDIIGLASSSDGRTLTAASAGGGLYVSIDGGGTWSTTTTTAGWSSVASSSDGNRLTATGSAGVFTSTPSFPALSYLPFLNGAGPDYARFTFQVGDSGPDGLNLDPVARPLAINVTNSNDAPVVAGGVPDQIVPPSGPFTYRIPDNAITDPDAGDVLTFKATLANGSPLPSWLHFNPGSRELSSPAGALVSGAHAIRITARDSGFPALEVSTEFLLIVQHHPPQGADRTFTLDEDTEHMFSPADFGFTDAADSPPNIFRKVWLATAPTAGTLSVDGLVLDEGDQVSMFPDARMRWTPGASSQTWRDLATSADGMRLAAVWGSGHFAEPAGEIFLSSDGGATWSIAMGGKSWRTVAMSADGTRLAAGAYDDRIHVSSDSGLTWTPTGSVAKWAALAISADGSRLLAAPENGALQVSFDGGLTWEPRTASVFPSWNAAAMSADGRVMVAAGWALCVSTDGGTTWTEHMPGQTWLSLAISADGSRIAATAESGYWIMYSDDFGASWAPRGESRLSCIACSSDGIQLVGSDTHSRLYVSADAGHSWSRKEEFRSWRAVASSADGQRLAAATMNGLIYTSVAAIPQLVYRPAPNDFGDPYGSFDFRVEDDGVGGTSRSLIPNTFKFRVTPVPDAPLPPFMVMYQAAIRQRPFSYMIPDFNDPDPGAILTYSVTRQNGVPLPAWLSFNPATRRLAGTPSRSDTGLLDLRVTATDNGIPPLSGSGPLLIHVLQADQRPSGADAHRTIVEDVPWTFTTDDFGFTDVQDVPPGQFIRVRLNTLPSAGTLFVDDAPAVPGAMVRMIPSPPGTHWESRGPVLPWTCISMSADGHRLAAASDGQIHTSNDGGLTWTPRHQVRAWTGIASSADGLRLAAVARDDEIHVSSDGGVTWAIRGPAHQWIAVASSADGSRLAAVHESGSIFVSQDFGNSWLSTGPKGNWNSIASSADGQRLVAGRHDDYLHVSKDGGATWSPRDLLGGKGVCASADGMRMAAIRGSYIYISVDGGETWSPREEARAWRGITSSADGTRLAAFSNSGLFHSTDGGITWRSRGGQREWRAVAISANGERLAGAVSQGALEISYIVPAQRLVFVPEANAAASPYTSFRFQVEDDGAAGANLDFAARTFTFHVLGSNDAPTLDPIPDPPVVAAEAGPQSVALSGVSAGGGESQTLVIEATSSRPDLVPHPEVIYTSPQAQGLLRYTPVPGAAGSAVVTVTVRDDGGTENGGADHITRRFTVTLMSLFHHWAVAHGLPLDANVDGGANLLKYAFGLEPHSRELAVIEVTDGVIRRRGLPVLLSTGSPSMPAFSVLFSRLKSSDLAYRAEFSADLATWEPVPAPAVPAAADDLIEAFTLPFPPALSDGRPPRFVRVKILTP